MCAYNDSEYLMLIMMLEFKIMRVQNNTRNRPVKFVIKEQDIYLAAYI